MESQPSVSRYPLAWPSGWTRHSNRKRAQFKHYRAALSVYTATERLEGELRRLGARHATLSTNVELRLDGRHRSDRSEPSDPGVAVYFTFKGRATVFACDTWDRTADNIAAIAKHIDSLRAIERYGVGTIEQALAGYKALPADTAADWRMVFGFAKGQRVTAEQFSTAYKQRARECHPDQGGTDEAMFHLNRAKEYAQAEIGP